MRSLFFFRLRGGVVIIEAVPKSPAGKILRRLLNDTKGLLVHVVSSFASYTSLSLTLFRSQYEDKIRAKL